MTEANHLHLVAGGDSTTADTELLRLKAEVEARDRQGIALAELGQAALTGIDSDILLGQACALVEATLRVDHCRVIQICSNGAVRMKAALGGNQTFLHCTHDGDEDESLGMATLMADGPLAFPVLERETRFKGTHLHSYHGIHSGAAVAIRSHVGPYGVIAAYCNESRSFADHELAFLRSVASIAGEAIARERTQDALRTSESRLRQLIATTLDAVVTIDRAMNVIEWNGRAEMLFGIPAREAIGGPLSAAILGGNRIRLFAALVGRYSDGRNGRLLDRRIEATARHVDGHEYPVEITLARAKNGDDVTFTAFIRDISHQKRAQRELEKRERRFRTIVEKSWSGVVLLDAHHRFSFIGSSTQHLVGYSEDELLGHSLFEFVHPREVEEARKTFSALLDHDHDEAHLELRFRHRKGRWIWLEGFTQNLLNEPSVGAIVLNYRDISQRKETEKELEYRAYYDSLTGLPNRLLFRDRLVHALAQAKRNRSGLAVMYLDIDHFKLVNDGLGHDLGDRLLADVAQRLRATLRDSDTVSRIGGDEFSVLLPEVANAPSVAGVARKILDSFADPFHLDGHDLFVTASIGVGCYPGDGEEAESLLKAADAAMYRAKELGRNQTQLFTSSMNERYVRRLALEQRLHHAIEREQLELHYQPIFDRARRRITSVEALVRWRDPQRGLIPPVEFIPLAEETGMILSIGEWVLRTACRQIRKWSEAGLTDLTIAINISAVQLQQRGFAELVRSTLSAHEVRDESLRIEITESAAMQNFETTRAVLQELRSMGVGVSIDDFGTGQSSLIYLKHFPIDAVKIDKEFLSEVTSDETAAAIVSYIINLAHTLGLTVVAEGVETEEQFAFLRHYACDQMQGYLFSRPLTSTELTTFLRQDLQHLRHVETIRAD